MSSIFENKLVITGEKEQVAAFQDAVIGRNPWRGGEMPFTPNNIIPIPEEIVKELFKPDGFCWCVDHWGTKQGSLEVSREGNADEGKLLYRFNTMNNPFSVAFIEKTSQKFPDVNIAYFYNSKEAFAEGILVARKGKILGGYESKFREDYTGTIFYGGEGKQTTKEVKKGNCLEM